MLHRIFGRATRSGVIFSPYSSDPYTLPGLDIYNLIRRDDEQRTTRQLDQALAQLEPVHLDDNSSQNSGDDDDYYTLPLENIDLELSLELPTPEPNVHRPPPPSVKKRASVSASLSKLKHPVPPRILPIIRIPRLSTTPSTSAIPAPPRAVPSIIHVVVPPKSAQQKPTPPTPAHAKPTSDIIRVRRISTNTAPVLPSTSIPLPLIRAVRPLNSTQIRKRQYQRAHRLEKRQTAQHLSGSYTKRIVTRRVQESTPIFTSLNAVDLHTTSTVWCGVRIRKPDTRTYSLPELRAAGMTFLLWDGRSCRPLLDAKHRVFACLAGRPRPHNGQDSYEDAVQAATELFATTGARATGDGRRGDFVAVSAGVSYGGGQKRPGVLLNTKNNAAICAILVAHWSLQRIAQFSNGIFKSFAPLLHEFYREQTSLLHRSAPFLRRLFPEAISVFAACTFNFGPNTVTFPHVDAANLAWGWCSITALGNFNPDLGGHLILWDLNLVIRFPPGSTIMIPSALLRHSNISIQQGETRYSFTQYTAGSLFRWVANGNRADTTFFATATSADLEEREAECAQRWENGLRMFKVWHG